MVVFAAAPIAALAVKLALNYLYIFGYVVLVSIFVPLRTNYILVVLHYIWAYQKLLTVIAFPGI